MALRGEMPPSMSTADAYLKAKQSASEALRLDSNLANAHSALALNYLYNEFNWTEAKAEFGRAIELNASYADAHRWNGLLLSALHQPYEAIEELKLAFKLEPLSPSISTALGDGYFISRQYDKAIDQYEKTLEKNPEYGGAKRNLASAFVETKKYEQAVDLLQQTKDIKGDLLFKGELAYAYAVWGQQRKARKLLAKLDDPFEIAIVYAGLGDKSHALDSLRKAVDSHNSLLFHLPIHPAFDALRSQPDFQALLRRINYPNA
jgi:tetratricopeptide (TPR) repeat protein